MACERVVKPAKECRTVHAEVGGENKDTTNNVISICSPRLQPILKTIHDIYPYSELV